MLVGATPSLRTRSSLDLCPTFSFTAEFSKNFLPVQHFAALDLAIRHREQPVELSRRKLIHALLLAERGKTRRHHIFSGEITARAHPILDTPLHF